jgi:CheY-like chemotaxis protein
MSAESDALSGLSSIMLVDDSIILRDRLAEAFEERGFRVLVAGTCDEAVEKFKLSPTDLAVVDLRMPGRSGLSLIQDIKQISPDVRVLILSGFGHGHRRDQTRCGEFSSQTGRCRRHPQRLQTRGYRGRDARDRRGNTGPDVGTSRMGAHPSRACRLQQQHL